MAKYTNTVTLAAANTWQELSALANVHISAPYGIQIGVADAVADLAAQAGHVVSAKEHKPMSFTGLGTKKVFAYGPIGAKIVVTAYA